MEISPFSFRAPLYDAVRKDNWAVLLTSLDRASQLVSLAEGGLVRAFGGPRLALGNNALKTTPISNLPHSISYTGINY
ncbi:MAG: hypothetical protein PHQ34_09185 [Methanothrix sp.]|nr:hypothetical protein [Methanothrix sp.]